MGRRADEQMGRWVIFESMGGQMGKWIDGYVSGWNYGWAEEHRDG